MSVTGESGLCAGVELKFAHNVEYVSPHRSLGYAKLARQSLIRSPVCQ